MDIFKGVFKKSVFIILPAVAVSAFLEWKRVPQGIFIGWLFGILNLRMMTKNVKGLIGSEQATAKIVVLSIIRLAVLLTAMGFLLYYKTINIFGLVFGFTVVFALILIEGMKAGKANKGESSEKV
jgi:hypothetical protein